MKKQIALLLVSTNRYKQFVQPLLNGVVKNFLPSHQITVHLFTDEYQDLIASDRVQIKQHIIPPYKFPLATLLRFKVFLTQKEEILKSNYCYYLDVDMSVELPVQEEIFGDITVIRHPGFWYNNGWGSQSTDPLSLAYLPPEYRKKYYCGGFNGGATDKFMQMCEILAENIDKDEQSGHRAEHNDETALNWFTNFYMERTYPDWKINELNPSYCSVPELHQRQLWKIDHLPMKIIALTKDHEEMRA